MLKPLAKMKLWMKNRYGSRPDVEADVEHVSPIEEPPETKVEEAALPEVNGSVAFINGEFNITDPVGIGMYASLAVSNRFREYVLVDGQSIGQNSVILTSATRIHVETPHVPPKTDVTFAVSEDGMSVSMTIQFKHGTNYAIMPFEPKIKAVLQIDEMMEPAKGLCFDELLDKLRMQGFHGTIDEQALREMSEVTFTTRKVVLRGTRAIAGTPPVLKPAPLPKGYDPIGRLRPLNTVNIGAIVGYIVDGTPSTPGIDVYGHHIRVPEPKVPLPFLGDGVTRIHNNVIAIRSGRVSFNQSLVDVVPQLVLHKDVTPREGHISFDGDIVIYGTIQDGSRVKADGKVIVHGGAFGATIVGEHGVVINGSCVKSKIWAGWAQELYKDVLSSVHSLISMLDIFEKDFTRILEHLEAKDVPNEKRALIAGVLIEQHHTEILPSLSQLVTHYKSTSLHQVAAHLEPIVHMIRTKWLGLQYKHLMLSNVQELASLLLKYKIYIETTISEDKANVTVESVTSSTIHCTGRVEVTGFGVYASAIECGQTIDVKGMVRGGFLTAQHSIHVRELGSETGTETSAKVLNPEGMIDVALRHPNTVLDVAQHRDRNLLPEQSVLYKGNIEHHAKHTNG